MFCVLFAGFLTKIAPGVGFWHDFSAPGVGVLHFLSARGGEFTLSKISPRICLWDGHAWN